MGRNHHHLSATIALALSADVPVFFVHFISRFTVGALFVLLTTSRHFMMMKTVLSVKLESTITAWNGRFLTLVVIWTWVVMLAFTRSTRPAFTWVIVTVFVIEAFVAVVTPITSIREPSHGGTSFIVVVTLEQPDDVRCLRPTKDDKGRFHSANDLQLIWRVQCCKVPLERLQFP